MALLLMHSVESNSIYSVIFSLTLVDYSSKQPDIHETILCSKSCAKVVQ